MSFYCLFRQCSRLFCWQNIVLAVLILCGGIVLYSINPAGSDFYMNCPFYFLTGYHCPGCGSLRGMHQLLHGNMGAAFSLNPLFAILIPALTGVYLFKRKLLQQTWMPIALLVLILLYWVLRNIPFAPFIMLAPH